MAYTFVGFSPYQQVTAIGGTAYTADVNGNITAVVLADVSSLNNLGGRIADSASTPGANGLFTTQLPLLTGKNADGTTLAASAAAGKYGLSLTAGTSEALTTEAANNNTKTDTVVFEHQLPRTYIAAQNITVTANAQYTLGSGTVGTHTLTGHAYKCANAGTQGADLIATAAQTVGAAAGDLTFTITGTTLSPLDRIVLTLVLVIQDTGASNITAQVNSVRFS